MRTPVAILGMALLFSTSCSKDATEPKVDIQGRWILVAANGAPLPNKIVEPCGDGRTSSFTVTGGDLEFSSSTVVVSIEATETHCDGESHPDDDSFIVPYFASGSHVVIQIDEEKLEGDRDGRKLHLLYTASDDPDYALKSLTYEKHD
jgi:hypothetical protein